MERTTDFQGYGGVAPVRARAASEAARLGAVAALVRSAGTGYHRLAHTGAMRYDPAVARIPTAALAAEDADLIHRLLAGGATGEAAPAADRPLGARGRWLERGRRPARAGQARGVRASSAATSIHGTSAPARWTTPPAAASPSTPRG